MKKWRVSLVMLVLILLGIGIGSMTYLDGYYRADMEVFSYLNETKEYSVEVSTDCIIFNPAEADTGIIFYPGGLVQFESYTPILARLAEQGVFCALIKMPGNLAMFDLDAADKIDRSLYPNIEHWYMAGHSLGGAMASNYLSKNMDKYDGIILLASYSADMINKEGLKVVLIKGSNDEVLNLENYEKNKSNLPSDYVEYTIEGGCHGYFGDYGDQKGDGVPTITREEQQRLTVEAILAQIV